MAQKRNYWLVKSEPESYSIRDLQKEGKTAWTGVRNYQARNFMRDEMRVGDPVLFYHSNTATPAVVGIGEVASPSYPDPTQFDSKSEYFDPKATKEVPRWFLVDIRFKKMFKKAVTLEELKTNGKFHDMVLTQKGSRLSVQPVEKKHFERIVKMTSA